tara:strand:+ start:419 stop:601 length:183 start_codon:yes stop_codon:yes gene_type:complete
MWREAAALMVMQKVEAAAALMMMMQKLFLNVQAEATRSRVAFQLVQSRSTPWCRREDRTS